MRMLRAFSRVQHARTFGLIETELMVAGGHIELIHNVAGDREPMVPPVLRDFLQAAEGAPQVPQVPKEGDVVPGNAACEDTAP